MPNYIFHCNNALTKISQDSHADKQGYRHDHHLVRYCHFGVSPVNYSDSDHADSHIILLYRYSTHSESESESE